MCRFYIYIGDNNHTNIYCLLFNKDNSITKQCYKKSYHPNIKDNNSRDCDINVDGFGVGWYVGGTQINNIDHPNSNYKNVVLYKNTIPPKNDINLKNMIKHTYSNLIFAHIRAVKHLDSMIHYNDCHPFTYRNYMFMHNGIIEDFLNIKRRLIFHIKDRTYKQLKGSTDSEHIFLLFLDQLSDEQYEKGGKLKNIDKMLANIINFINSINYNNKILSLNIAITDGYNMACSRYINKEELEPPSLYYKSDYNYIEVSSEPISLDEDEYWTLMPKNKMITVEDHKLYIIDL
jgi:glutamine amidotransferase